MRILKKIHCKWPNNVKILSETLNFIVYFKSIGNPCP